jgi:hypothetical protein
MWAADAGINFVKRWFNLLQPAGRLNIIQLLLHFSKTPPTARNASD